MPNLAYITPKKFDFALDVKRSMAEGRFTNRLLRVFLDSPNKAL